MITTKDENVSKKSFDFKILKQVRFESNDQCIQFLSEYEYIHVQ